MAMMEITVVPTGTGKTSASPYIAKIFKHLRKQKKVRYELNGMGTILTGKTEELFKMALVLHKIPFSMGVKRVYTVMKLDDRKDKNQLPIDKVDSVLRKI